MKTRSNSASAGSFMVRPPSSEEPPEGRAGEEAEEPEPVLGDEVRGGESPLGVAEHGARLERVRGERGEGAHEADEDDGARLAGDEEALFGERPDEAEEYA